MSQKLSILERVADKLTIGLVVLDKDQKIIIFNKRAGELLKEEPGPRVDSSVLRCHPERAEPGVMKMINQFKSKELESYDGWVHFRGGFLYEFIYPVWDENGEYLATVSEMHDMPEKIEYLKSIGKWKPPEEHGVGESMPRIPFPVSGEEP